MATSTISLLGKQGVWIGVSTNVNAVAIAPPEPIHVAGFSRGSSTSATRVTEASTNRIQVLPAQEQMGPTENVPPHSTSGIVAIGSGGGQPSILTEYTQDADGYWRDAMDIRYSRIEPVRPGDAPTYIEAGIVDAFRTVERVIDWYHDEEPFEGPPKIASQVAVVSGENEDPSSTPDPLTSDVHRNVKTMESDLGCLQGIGRLDHHVEGDYYVDENNVYVGIRGHTHRRACRGL